MLTIQWFHYNAEQMDLCAEGGEYVKQAEGIIRVVPNYLRSQGFIAYRVLQIINELLRVVFSFQQKNQQSLIDEAKQESLLELIEDIKSKLEQIMNSLQQKQCCIILRMIKIIIKTCFLIKHYNIQIVNFYNSLWIFLFKIIKHIFQQQIKLMKKINHSLNLVCGGMINCSLLILNHQYLYQSILKQSENAFNLQKYDAKKLRGGGCGSLIGNKDEDTFLKNIQLPYEFLEKLDQNCELLIKLSQMIVNDQNSLTHISLAIMWFHYNSEYINLCAQRGNYVRQIYQLFLSKVEKLLQVLPNYIRSQSFIGYRILQIINELLRVVFSFQQRNLDRQFDEKTKDQLLEFVENIKTQLQIENEEIWKTGVEYELSLIEIMLHNCNINRSTGKGKFQDFILNLIKSTCSLSITDELIENLIDGGNYLINMVYEKVSYPKEVYFTYYYFQTLKWNTISIIRKQQQNVSVQTCINKLIAKYQEYVEKSEDWMIHYTWVQLMCDLLSYRVIVNKDTLSRYSPPISNQQKWNFLIENKQIKTLPYQKNFATIQLYTNFQLIDFDQRFFAESLGKYQIFCEALMRKKFNSQVDFWSIYSTFSFRKQQNLDKFQQASQLILSKIGDDLLDPLKDQLVAMSNKKQKLINDLEILLSNQKIPKPELELNIYLDEINNARMQLHNALVTQIYISLELQEKINLVCLQTDIVFQFSNKAGYQGDKQLVNDFQEIQNSLKQNFNSMIEEIIKLQKEIAKVDIISQNLKLKKDLELKGNLLQHDDSKLSQIIQGLSKLKSIVQTLSENIYSHFKKINNNKKIEENLPELSISYKDFLVQLSQLFSPKIYDSYSQEIQKDFINTQSQCLEDQIIEAKQKMQLLEILINLHKIKSQKMIQLLQNFDVTKSNTQILNNHEMPLIKNLILTMLENCKNSFQYAIQTNLVENQMTQRVNEFSKILENNVQFVASINSDTNEEDKLLKNYALKLIGDLQKLCLEFYVTQFEGKSSKFQEFQNNVNKQLIEWNKKSSQCIPAQQNPKSNKKTNKIFENYQICEKGLKDAIEKLDLLAMYLKIDHIVTQQSKQVDNKNSEVDKKNSEVVENEREVVEKEREVVEKERQVVEKERQVVEKEREVIEKEREVVEKEREVVEKEREVVEKERQVVEKERQVVEKEREVIEKEREVEYQHIRADILKIINQNFDKIKQIFQEFFSELNRRTKQNPDLEYKDWIFLLNSFCQSIDYQEYNIDQIYIDIIETIKKTKIEGQAQNSGNDYKVRECLIMNLIKVQACVQEEEIIRFVQWQIKQIWAIETDERVRALLKNKDLLEMQKKLFQKDLQTFSSQLQTEMQGKIDQLSFLEQGLRLEGNEEIRKKLQKEINLAYQDMDQYVENISEMSAQINVSLVFLKEIVKDLKQIKNKIDTLVENVNQIADDVRKLRGKTYQELLQIRRKRVLQTTKINEADSIYIPLKTLEINSKTGELKKSNEGKEITYLLVEDFSDKTSKESLDGEINEFLWAEDNQKFDVLLIRGQAGSGKSRSTRKIEEFIWKVQDQDPHWIPIYVSLPQIANPKFNLFDQAMKSEFYNFDSTQTRELKEAIRMKKINVIFIFDSYDEMKSECIQQNLILTNNFQSDFEIQKEPGKFVKFIITTRIEILNPTKYKNWFCGNSIDNLKDIELIKFDENQIDDYLKKYVELSAKRKIRNLYELIKQLNKEELDTNEFEEIWLSSQQIVLACNTQNENQEFLFDYREEEKIIKLIKSHKIFKHIKDEYIIALRKDLQSLWSSMLFKRSIMNVNIEQILTTPFMLEIVVQVLPQMLKQESDQSLFKEWFSKNLYQVLKRQYRSSQWMKQLQISSNDAEGYKKQEKVKIIEEINDIIEKLEKSNFFLNCSQIDKIEIQNQALLIRGIKYEVGSQVDLIAIALKMKHYTIYEFYDCFIAYYHNQQIFKLVQLGKIQNLDSFQIDVFKYSQSLALDLTIHQQIQIIYKSKGKLKLSNYKELEQQKETWEDQYINDQEDNQEYLKLIRSCSLLSMKGTSLQFNHKSIQEFLVAKYIYDEMQQQEKQQNYEETLAKSVFNQNEFNISKENYVGTIALLKPQLNSLEKIDQKLIHLLKTSTNTTFIRSASNSAYLLSQRSTFLGGLEFEGIQLQDTNLFGLSFFGSNLSGSNFQNVIIDSCNFNLCNLDNTSWNKIQCKELPYLKEHEEKVLIVAFSHDGQLLASGGADSQAIIWDLKAYKVEIKIDHKQKDQKQVNVNCVSFFQNSSKLVTGGSNCVIKIFDISNFSNYKLLYYLEDHGRNIIKIIFSQDEKAMYSVDESGFVIIWNVDNFQDQSLANGQDSLGIIDLVFTSSGEFFYAIDENLKQIGYYEYQNKNCLNFIAINDFKFYRLILSQNDYYLASANQNGGIAVWDVSKNEIFKLIYYEENCGTFKDFQFTPDNKFLSILYDDVLVHKNFQVFTSRQYNKFLNCLRGAISKTDDLLVLQGKDIIYNVDLTTNQMINSINLIEYQDFNENSKYQLLFSSENSQLVFKISYHVMVFWDLHSFQEKYRITTFSDQTILSYDQKILIQILKDVIIVQNISNTLLQQDPKQKVIKIYFSSIVKSIAILQGGYDLCVLGYHLEIRNIQSLKQINETYFENNKITSMSASQNQSFFLIGTKDGSIFLIRGSERPQEFLKRNHSIKYLAISYDDTVLAMVNKNKIILIDFKTKEQLNYESRFYNSKIISSSSSESGCEKRYYHSRSSSFSERENYEDEFCHANLLFSPSQEILAYVSGYDVVFYNYEANEDFVIQSHEYEISDIAFSPSNQYFASLGRDMQIVVQNLITKQKIVSEVNYPQNNGKNYIRLLFLNLDTFLTFSLQGIVKFWKIQNSSSLFLQSIKELGNIQHIVYHQLTNRLIIAKLITVINNYQINGQVLIAFNLDDFYNTEFFENTSSYAIAGSSKNHMIAQSLNSKIRVIQVIEKQILFELDNQAQSKALSFASNDQLLANYGEDTSLKIWNLQSQETVLKVSLYDSITKIYFSEKNDYIFCQGQSVNIFHLKNSDAIEIAEIFFQHQIIFESSLKNNVFGFHQKLDNSVQIMKNWIRNENQRFQLDIPRQLIRLSYSKQKFLAVFGEVGNLKVWQLSNQDQFWEFESILCYEFDQNEKLLLVEKCGNIRLLDLENDYEQFFQGYSPQKEFQSFKGLVKFLADNILIIASSNGFSLFSIKDKQLKLIQKICAKLKDFKSALTIKSYFWIKLQNGKFMNLKHLEQKNCLETNYYLINSMDISYDQKYLAFIGARIEPCIWDLETLNVKKKMERSYESGYGIVFIDSSQIIFNQGKIIYSADLQFNKKEIRAAQNVITSLSYQKKSNLLALGDSKQVLVWDIKSKTQLASFSGPQNSIKSLCFSPNGSIIASGGDDKVIRLWNANSISNQISEDCHTCEISALCFSTDGQMYASSSTDGQFRLWSVQSKRCLSEWQDYNSDSAYFLKFSENSDYLFSMCHKKAILLDIKNLMNFNPIILYSSGDQLIIKKIHLAKNSDIIVIDKDKYCCWLNGYKIIENSQSSIIINTPERIDSYQFIPYSSSIAYLTQGKIKIFDCQTKRNQDLNQSNIMYFAFTDDGKNMATINKKMLVSIWNHQIQWEIYKSVSLQYQIQYQISSIFYMKFSDQDSQLNFVSETHVSFFNLKNIESNSKSILTIEKQFSNIQFFTIDYSQTIIALIDATDTEAIFICQLDNFNLIKSFQVTDCQLKMISFSFDSQYLSAAGDQGEIFIWDYLRGEIFKTYKFEGNIIYLSFLEKQFHTLILYQNLNREIIIINFNLQTELKQKFENSFSGYFEQIKVSPFGNYLAFKKFQEIQLFEFDIENQKLHEKILNGNLRYYQNSVMSFDIGETQLIVGGDYGYIKCFEIKSCNLIYEIKIEYLREINNILIFDENQVFISQKDCLYRITINEQHQISINDSLYFQSKIENFLIMKNERLIILYCDKILRKLKNENQNNIMNYCFFEQQARHPPIILDNGLVYTMDYNYIKAYDLKTKIKKYEKVVDSWLNMYISKDEQLFIFIQLGNIKLLRFEDLNNFKDIKTFESHSERIKKVEVSQDHKYLASVCEKSIVKLWNIIDLKNPIILYVYYSKCVLLTMISHNSSYLSWWDKNQIIIQKIEKCERILKRYFKLQDDLGHIMEIDLIMQNDKQSLIIFTTEQLLLKDLKTDETNIILELEFPFRLKFCDNYKVCACTDSDGKNIRIIKNPFELAKSHHEIKNPYERIFSISLSKDGEYLLSGGEDGFIRIWCMQKYTQLLQFFLGDQVTNVFFSPDGFHLVAGTDQGAVCLFISNLSKDKLKKKYFKLAESLGEDHKIGCLKVFSQQPQLQMQNCQDSNQTINQQDQSLTQDQSLQVLFKQKQQNVK